MATANLSSDLAAGANLNAQFDMTLDELIKLNQPAKKEKRAARRDSEPRYTDSRRPRNNRRSSTIKVTYAPPSPNQYEEHYQDLLVRFAQFEERVEREKQAFIIEALYLCPKLQECGIYENIILKADPNFLSSISSRRR